MDRFWDKVEKTDGCWNWTSTKNEKGYGRFKIGVKNPRAHRLSFEMHFGSIPEGMQVLHRCDNPGCVNPDHLFLGTNQDNMADKVAKGRQAHVSGGVGEAAGMAKLTNSQVHEIRAATGKIAEIAEKFGMSPTQTSAIRNRRAWKHI